MELRLWNIEEEVSTHDTSINILEESVDDVQEGITDLQVVNNDILDRLTVVEEAVISKLIVHLSLLWAQLLDFIVIVCFLVKTVMFNQSTNC